MKHLLKIFVLFLCIVPTIYAKNTTSQLDEKYSNYYSRIQSDPQSVLDEILIRPEPQDNFDKAQSQYILSQAYYALVFPEKAIYHAKLELEHISE